MIWDFVSPSTLGILVTLLGVAYFLGKGKKREK